jgi:chaperonin GroES
MAARRLVPLLDRVLIERIVAPTKSAGGVLLPDSAVPKVNEGVVLAVGPGRRTKDGDLIAPSVKEGDKVLLPEYGGALVKLNDKECVFALFGFFWGGGGVGVRGRAIGGAFSLCLRALDQRLQPTQPKPTNTHKHSKQNKKALPVPRRRAARRADQLKVLVLNVPVLWHLGRRNGQLPVVFLPPIPRHPPRCTPASLLSSLLLCRPLCVQDF